MGRPLPKISELLRPPSRFMRSVQLNRDFHDPGALDDYVITPAMAGAFRRVAEGLDRGSGRRAWRVTGDYGVGKSSFALVLAQLLSGRASMKAEQIAGAIGWEPPADGRATLWPVLITGAREPIVKAVARGIAECIRQRTTAGPRVAKPWSAMAADAAEVERTGDPDALIALIASFRTRAAGSGAGVLLVIDEMGKLLEHAAGDASAGDVFILQRLAELAARSGGEPFFFVGLLHQGFQAYAEKLPTAVRHEWDKVAGRFEEIVFDQPLAHIAALVASALNVQVSRLHPSIAMAARRAAAATGSMGWLGGGTSTAAALDAAPLYPLHPTLLPPLVRFFARYGQHERSLFGFLLSSEPFGVQAFAAREAAPDAWYGLPEFYDYVRAVFGHGLGGGSYQSQWVRITAAVEAAHEAPAGQLRLLKAVAVLNLLDADDLPPTDRALAACLDLRSAGEAEAAAAGLVDRGLLFRRGSAGGYRLWPSSSVNLRSAFLAAERALGEAGSVSGHLAPHLPREPILARRHYVERGTLRHFAVRHVAAEHLGAPPSAGDADGLVLMVLADTEAERRTALDWAASPPTAERGDLVTGISQPLAGISAELKDLRCWQWVAANTPELAHDAYAAAEVSRQVAAARETVGRALDARSGLRSRSPQGVAWYHGGCPLDVGAKGLASTLSDVCDSLYSQAPRIANELLNRNVLSSAAAAARMRLIEGMFDSPELPLLGIDPVRVPPEKSMYLSVMAKGGLHREEGGRHGLAMPADDRDPLNLAPALQEVERLIEGGIGSRVGATAILDALAARPYGVRAGVAPLLVALVMKVRAHELAIYENGTFRPTFTGQDAMRLVKAPAAFEIQHCRIEGVRAEAFERLAEAFAEPHRPRRPEILDVVQPLCRFAARLPDYTRRAGALSPRAAAVRDVLLSASEPAAMLFKDLPVACGLEPFGPEREADGGRSRDFVARLQATLAELRADYPRLLGRIVATASEAVGGNGRGFDRAALAARAARVSLTAAQPRLRTFAMRLRDPGTSDDAWAEALASYVVSKPPSRWNASDEGRCHEELAGLADLFRKAEAAAFGEGRPVPDRAAVRINLTRADGEDHVRVVEGRERDAAQAAYLEAMTKILPSDRDTRMRVLMDLLWDEMAAPARATPAGEGNRTERAEKR